MFCGGNGKERATKIIIDVYGSLIENYEYGGPQKAEMEEYGKALGERTVDSLLTSEQLENVPAEYHGRKVWEILGPVSKKAEAGPEEESLFSDHLF